jgi:hypothetical protein
VAKFFQKCVLMAALLLVSAAAALTLIPPDRDDYLAIIGAKVERLKRTTSPKIVFVGGSNLAFGLDSRAVEEQLGYAVVNMGMGFNMGLRFMLDLVSPEIRTGDIVVLVPEYNLFYGLLDGDDRLIDVLELYPDGFHYIRSRDQLYNLANNLPEHIRAKLLRWLQRRKPDADCVYCPRAFNEYGDAVAHLDRKPADVEKMDFLRSTARGVDMEAIRVINAFAQAAEQHGARVVLIFPCVPEPHFERRHEAIDRLYAKLQQDLKVPMLSTPRDQTYPIGYFYDWVYHLNRQGRAVRTAKIIDELRPVVEMARKGAAEQPAVRTASRARAALTVPQRPGDSLDTAAARPAASVARLPR